MMADIKITNELRPCYIVNDILNVHIKMLFHGWFVKNDTPYGILECVDGSMLTAPFDTIVFADDMLNQYSFKPFEQILEIFEKRKGELFND